QRVMRDGVVDVGLGALDVVEVVGGVAGVVRRVRLVVVVGTLLRHDFLGLRDHRRIVLFLHRLVEAVEALGHARRRALVGRGAAGVRVALLGLGRIPAAAALAVVRIGGKRRRRRSGDGLGSGDAGSQGGGHGNGDERGGLDGGFHGFTFRSGRQREAVADAGNGDSGTGTAADVTAVRPRSQPQEGRRPAARACSYAGTSAEARAWSSPMRACGLGCVDSHSGAWFPPLAEIMFCHRSTAWRGSNPAPAISSCPTTSASVSWTREPGSRKPAWAAMLPPCIAALPTPSP